MIKKNYPVVTLAPGHWIIYPSFGELRGVLWQDDLYLLLMLHLLEIHARAGPGHLSGKWDNGEVIAVADLDHESVGVVEEELVDVYPSFLHLLSHVLDPHLLQLLLHCSYALALYTPRITISNNCLW